MSKQSTTEGLDDVREKLEEESTREFQKLRDEGHIPTMYDEYGWMVPDSEQDTSAERVMYLAGRYSGLTEAMQMIENEQSE